MLFELNAPNPFVRKTFELSKLSNSTTVVNVVSPFFGKWDFTIEMDYDLVAQKLNRYCSSNVMIQDIFPELTNEGREKFMSPPTMNLFNSNPDSPDYYN